jgi:hypothetical protein
VKQEPLTPVEVGDGPDREVTVSDIAQQARANTMGGGRIPPPTANSRPTNCLARLIPAG